MGFLYLHLKITIRQEIRISVYHARYRKKRGPKSNSLLVAPKGWGVKCIDVYIRWWQGFVQPATARKRLKKTFRTTNHFLVCILVITLKRRKKAKPKKVPPKKDMLKPASAASSLSETCEIQSPRHMITLLVAIKARMFCSLDGALSLIYIYSAMDNAAVRIEAMNKTVSMHTPFFCE